jgi:N-acetylneuraminic acid mutarotase
LIERFLYSFQEEGCIMKTIRYSSIALGVVLATAGLLALASICLAQDSPWTAKADMPTPRSHLSTCVVNGKIYAIGGNPNRGGCGSPASQKVEEYDPSTNTWSTNADMPAPRAVCLSALFF